MSEISYPEIFILGAPKAGTTALYHNLSAHPQIFDAEIKEPNFFATDFPAIALLPDRSDYLDLYNPRGGQIAIDGSATSFYSAKAVDNILAQRPDAKFLIILRNPADMLFSLHGQTRLALLEPEGDFIKVWEDSDRRWSNRTFDKHLIPQVASFREAGRIGHYTAEHMKKIPQGQLHVMLLEDFQTDFRKTYLHLLDFLGLEDDGLQEWSRANEASERHFKWLAYLLSTSGPLGGVKKWLKGKLGLYNTDFMKGVHRATVRPPKEKKRLPAATRTMLIEHFSDDIALLEKLIDRDLSHWRDAK